MDYGKMPSVYDAIKNMSIYELAELINSIDPTGAVTEIACRGCDICEICGAHIDATGKTLCDERSEEHPWDVIQFLMMPYDRLLR